MILLIDNYDSFVYNLARYVSELGHRYQVVRNDKITLTEISNLQPTHIIFSPGPCAPDQAGITLAAIKQFAGQIPMLGVCLGHQAIGQAFGGTVTQALKPMHGKFSWLTHPETKLFKTIPSPCKIARYHSLIVSKHNFPEQLEITAESQEGEIMALQHRHWPIFGVQFHPESVLTDHGYQILKNFLTYDRN